MPSLKVFVLEVAPYLELDADSATSLIAEMATSIADKWRWIATAVGMTRYDMKAEKASMENDRGERATPLARTSVPGGLP